ncbi:SurA N-terminal domain-containing protein [Caenispirillum salinarum]|uniref:peptidylprolyl isomerase n=1 Tax=Caenispirillum salinarum TaxID=859058 RepID=UPI00384FEDC5
MLDALRRGASKGPAKVLFILLIFSFGIWGIGDVVRGVGGDVPAIEVGDVEVSPQTVRAAFQREVERLRGVLGPEITAERARDLGVVDQVIAQLARQAVVDAAAADLGVQPAPQDLRQRITEIPAFQNQQGQFDRDLFRRVLAQNNLTEEQFLRGLSQDLTREALLNTASAGAVAPQPLVVPLFERVAEERRAAVLRVPDAAQELPPVPADPELRTVYDENIEAFTAPEYRALTALVMRPSDLTDEVNVTEEELRAEYEAMLPQLEEAEQRVISQVLVGDEQTARAVAEAAQGGATLADAAEQAGAPPPLDLGAMTADTLPPSAADVVFGMEEGAVSDAVQTPIGWHVFHVAEILAGETPSLEDVRDQVRERIAADKAVDVLYDLTADVEDALGGGATLEEAARQSNLELLTIPAVDPQGLGPEGAPVSALPEEEVFLNTAFSLEAGRESLLEEIGRGFFIVRVDEITPPQPRPFEDVREDVVALWQAETRQTLSEETARGFADRIREGARLPALAEEAGLPHGTTPPFRRDAQGLQTPAGPLPAAAVAELFQADAPGAVAVARGRDGWVVAKLTDILPVEQPTQAQGFEQVRTEIRRGLADDLSTQLLEAFADRYGVTVDRALIERTL